MYLYLKFEVSNTRVFKYTINHQYAYTFVHNHVYTQYYRYYKECLYTMTCVNGVAAERNHGADVIEYSEGLCVERELGWLKGSRGERSVHTSNQGTWEIDYNVRGTRSWHAVTFDVIYSYGGTACLYSSPSVSTDLIMSNYLIIPRRSKDETISFVLS